MVLSSHCGSRETQWSVPWCLLSFFYLSFLLSSSWSRYLPFPSDLTFIFHWREESGIRLRITAKLVPSITRAVLCLSFLRYQTNWLTFDITLWGIQKSNCFFVDYSSFCCESKTHTFSTFLHLKWKLIILMFSLTTLSLFPKHLESPCWDSQLMQRWSNMAHRVLEDIGRKVLLE